VDLKTPSGQDLTAAGLTLVPTADGSFTFFSDRFQESFHSYWGANQEALGKYVGPTRLIERASQPQLRLLDICYGLGYNSAAALETIWAHNPHCQVELVALELDGQVPQAAIAQGLLQTWSMPVQQILAELARQQVVKRPGLSAQLWLGDARQTIQQVSQFGFRADAIFLDPFSPPHCPELWTAEFLGEVSQCLAATGYLATYSCAAAVRNALVVAGLQIGSSAPVGRRAPGTLARWRPEDLPPLTRQEQEHLQTQAGIPYRDPQGQDRAESILQRRHQEQQASQRESTSSWKRRWYAQDSV
jgi:tRNA U34 5-methylaminomethyl-2-thiouridine-forming methyltransferase MnmC